MTAGVQTTTTLTGTETVIVDNGGAVIVQAAMSTLGKFQGSFTTASMSNSTSITLSATFTALTFTQTSTGNTVNLPAAPTDGQLCGFSIDSNVTNLTVSSAANTVKNGAATSTTSAGATLWWAYKAAGTTWWRYEGTYLSQ